MEKIIISNQAKGLSDIECLNYVKRVMQEGRLSNNDTQYCRLTTFEYKDTERYIKVLAELNSYEDDEFTVYGVYKDSTQTT